MPDGTYDFIPLVFDASPTVAPGPNSAALGRAV
jgi:hypothetical protein